MGTGRQAYEHDIYQKMSHAERIHVIYRKTVLKQTIQSLSEETRLCYNSIRNILRAYRNTGRTNKLSYKTIKFR